MDKKIEHPIVQFPQSSERGIHADCETSGLTYMNNSLQNLLEKMEERGNDSWDIKWLVPLFTFLINQQKEAYDKMSQVWDAVSKREFSKTDLSPVVSALDKLLKKEMKTEKISFPEIQRVMVENQPKNDYQAKHEAILKDILEALRDLKNEEKTIVIENKVPLDTRPLALPVTGMGPAEFRKYKARYHKINVKPQEAFDGARTVFTLVHLPEAGTDECWVGGVKLVQDAGDYTLIGQTVTFAVAPTAQPYFSYDVI